MRNFQSLEVVDRVSETQLQVGENDNIWLLEGLLGDGLCMHVHGIPQVRYIEPMLT